MSCPTPAKMVFDTRGAARAAAKWTEGHHQGMHQLRPYRCTCGRWHLTHLAGSDARRDRRARRRRAAR